MRNKITINDCHDLAKIRNGKCLSNKYKNSKTKLSWQCEKEHIWQASYSNIKLHWCFICANLKKRLTLEECQQKANSLGGKCLSTEYIGNNKKMLWECGKGHIWEGKYEHIKNSNSWCPKCVGRNLYTINDCVKIAKQHDGYCLSNEFKLASTKYLWQCKKGHQWNAPFAKIRDGSWCALCLRHDLEYCQEYAKKFNGRCLSDKYIDNKKPLMWQCAKNHIWKHSLCEQKRIKEWCFECGKVKRLELCFIECQKIAAERDGYCLSKKFTSMFENMLWQCKKGHIWQANFNNIKNAQHWCHQCTFIISKPQKEIFNFCLEQFPQFNIILNDTQTIKPKQLDIYIPELKLAIEYDGEYWHYSDWAIKNGALKKINRKNRKCKKYGIKLVRIREKNWKANKEKYLNKLIKTIKDKINENENPKSVMHWSDGPGCVILNGASS